MKRAALLLLVLFAGALSACGGAKTAPAEPFAPGKFYDTLSADFGLSSMVVLDADAIYNYLGVPPEDYTEGVAAFRADSVLVDEIWVFNAADEAAAERILRAAEFRKEQLVSENRDYLPDQCRIAAAGKCVRKGNAVGLFIAPESEKMAEAFSWAAG